MARNAENHVSRERLLDKAEILFARKGYRAVTVREITKAAGCNLAAVNYYFGNKENLYLEVFRARWAPRTRRIHTAFRKSLHAQHSITPRNVIRSLAKAFLEGPMTDQERQRHAQLMTREMNQPTKAFEMVAGEVMGPFLKELAGMFEAFLPEGDGKDRLMLKLLSVFSLVLHFNYARLAVTRVTGRKYDPAFRAQLVDHIVDFALAGLGMNHQEVGP